MLIPYMSNAMLFQLVCEVVFIFFTLFFILREFRTLLKERLSYFKSFWNLVEIGIIGMSIAAIVIFFYRLTVTDDLTGNKCALILIYMTELSFKIHVCVNFWKMYI